jgi:tripartite ATP-independent transporter DctM subunit
MTGNALLGLFMLFLMVSVIFVGFPISFTLLFLGLVVGWIGLGTIVFDLAFFQTIGLMKEQTLAAVPLFIFMGYLVEQAGLMERLFLAFQHLLAPVRGSLYLGVILTATIFAMATGIVGAAVTVLGIMAAPIMMKSGYSPRLSAGAIAAGGTLGILIPPSVMLIVMGPVINVSVAKLYAAAFGPGFLLAGLYIVYTLTRSFLNPSLGPPVPKEERAGSFLQVSREVLVGMLPLAALITSTLGTILAGIVTPTEAAAMGATGAILLSIIYRRFTLKGLKTATFSTMATTSLVLFLAVASNVFGAIFARLGSAAVITSALTGLPVPPFVRLLLISGLIYLLAWPFDWTAMNLVFLPILYPVIESL